MLKDDINRYIKFGGSKLSFKLIFNLIFTQGIWAIVVYRFGSWCRVSKIPGLSILLKIIYFFLNKIIEIATGISLSNSAQIGKGLYIGHFGGIFIHSDAIIGENLSIGQGVTIGTLGLGKTGVPRIGNNVYIGVGAKILGGIFVGNNVKVGANAVVIKDVPDNSTVVGVPAQVVKTESNNTN